MVQRSAVHCSREGRGYAWAVALKREWRKDSQCPAAFLPFPLQSALDPILLVAMSEEQQVAVDFRGSAP